MNVTLKNRVFKGRYLLLGLLLLFVWLAQTVPGWGEFYARQLYPGIALCLSSFSNLFPFAVGDLFIALSLAGLMVYPFIVRRAGHKTWRNIALRAKYRASRSGVFSLALRVVLCRLGAELFAGRFLPAHGHCPRGLYTGSLSGIHPKLCGEAECLVCRPSC